MKTVRARMRLPSTALTTGRFAVSHRLNTWRTSLLCANQDLSEYQTKILTELDRIVAEFNESRGPQ